MKQQQIQNILVVRTDRIGDVILTLPTVEVLKSSFPKARVVMLVNSYTSTLVEGIAETLLYNEKNEIRKPFFEILSELRNLKFDAAVVAYPRFRIALLLWLARIPVRVGTGYRWFSFFFNKRVYEHRKTGEKHEAEYNISLARALGCKIPTNPVVRLTILDAEKQAARKIRNKLGLSDEDRMVLLHPGSGGSARNWKAERFAQLAGKLKEQGFSIVITGGRSEENLVNGVARNAGEGIKSFISVLNLKEFAAFIQTAKLFIANSTGPLHIAAAVGIPVIGFYPPVRVMSPKRWGPLTDKKVIFVPDPEKCQRCKGGECRGSECMEQIEVSQVVDAAIKLINVH